MTTCETCRLRVGQEDFIRLPRIPFHPADLGREPVVVHFFKGDDGKWDTRCLDEYIRFAETGAAIRESRAVAA